MTLHKCVFALSVIAIVAGCYALFGGMEDRVVGHEYSAEYYAK